MSFDSKVPQQNGTYYTSAGWAPKMAYATFTLEDGSEHCIGPIGPTKDEPYTPGEGFWQRVYDRGLSGYLNDGQSRTYAKLLALRSRVDAERQSLTAPAKALGDVVSDCDNLISAAAETAHGIEPR